MMRHSTETTSPGGLSIVLIPDRPPAQALQTRVAQARHEIEAALDLEWLVLSDGSSDPYAWAGKADDVHLLSHPQHRQIGPAIHTGLAYARRTYALVVPAAHLPQPGDLRRYLRAAQKADIVVGRRPDPAPVSLVERAVATTIQVLFGLPVTPLQLTVLYRMQTLRQVWIEYGHSPFVVPEILIKARDAGARVIDVTVDAAQPLPVRDAAGRILYDAAHLWLRRLTGKKEDQ